MCHEKICSPFLNNKPKWYHIASYCWNCHRSHLIVIQMREKWTLHTLRINLLSKARAYLMGYNFIYLVAIKIRALLIIVPLIFAQPSSGLIRAPLTRNSLFFIQEGCFVSFEYLTYTLGSIQKVFHRPTTDFWPLPPYHTLTPFAMTPLPPLSPPK